VMLDLPDEDGLALSGGSLPPLSPPLIAASSSRRQALVRTMLAHHYDPNTSPGAHDIPALIRRARYTQVQHARRCGPRPARDISTAAYYEQHCRRAEPVVAADAENAVGGSRRPPVACQCRHVQGPLLLLWVDSVLPSPAACGACVSVCPCVCASVCVSIGPSV
jgi:hypothetical protein